MVPLKTYNALLDQAKAGDTSAYYVLVDALQEGVEKVKGKLLPIEKVEDAYAIVVRNISLTVLGLVHGQFIHKVYPLNCQVKPVLLPSSEDKYKRAMDLPSFGTSGVYGWKSWHRTYYGFDGELVQINTERIYLGSSRGAILRGRGMYLTVPKFWDVFVQQPNSIDGVLLDRLEAEHKRRTAMEEARRTRYR